jgi:hypothetical protein
MLHLVNDPSPGAVLWSVFASYVRIVLTFGFATLAVALVIRWIKPAITINIIVRSKSDS